VGQAGAEVSTGNGARLHAWFHERLPAYAAGLLRGEEAEQFTRHAGECASCREALELFRREPGEQMRDEHIAPSIIARWGHARTTLRGLEREMVRRHIESCEVCRQGLRLLGFEPVLERIPELELQGDLDQRVAEIQRELDAESTPGPSRPIEADAPLMPASVPVPGRSRQRWIGAWATLATAAAFVMALLLVRQAGNREMAGSPGPSLGGASAQSHPNGPAATPPASSAAEHAVATLRSQNLLVLDDRERGVQADRLPVVRVAPDSAVIPLRATLPDVPQNSLVRAILRDPIGQVLLDELHPATEFYASRLLELRIHSAAREGIYEFELSGTRDGLAKRASYRFRLEVVRD
jgi:hypothetical protein